MEHGSARELLRASATDADAVRQYLQSIEANELDGLLDGIAPRTSKTKKKSEFLVKEDWLPLVHALVQCEATRLRAASRIIQVLRRGSPSELESMQLLTEISLGYSSDLDDLQELKENVQRTQHSVKRQKLLEEIRTVLDIVFSFLEEVVKDVTPNNGKVLPQLLGLVPYFLNLSEELKEEDAGASENLAKLLELPWSCQTVPSLLDVLVEDSSLMSRESWQHLQVNVERMVTTSPEMASETMNPMIRECVLVANVTGDHKWVGIVRYLLRQLPVHLRQVAEFNLQMSFNQSPRIVALVCESIRSSKVSRDGGVGMQIATTLFDEQECGAAGLEIDWRDLFLLLHCLQASKPVLHHRTSSSRIATEAAVFSDIEQLAWWIVQSDVKTLSSPTTNSTCSRTTGKTIEMHVRDQVELLLSFGGKQIHSREWKALLLMDMAFFWIEQSTAMTADDKVSTSKSASALMLLQAIFEMAPETRAEVLSSLFERSQKPAMKKLAGETISQLFISQSDKLFPHLNAIQDWLSLQFQRSLDGARGFFLIASRLATRYKDLYNFLMVFLRKLLSTGNRSHQQFAVDIWCTWLDHRLPFNEQQEEEIISALKNSVAACHDIQAWSFGRLEQVFQFEDASLEGPAISLQKCSWEELHRFLSREVRKFIVPKPSSFVRFGNEDSSDEGDDEDSGLSRFQFASLDGFYQQNASLDGAASIGLIFQKLLSCLIQFEKAVYQSNVSFEGLPIEGLNDKESDIKQWLVDVVSNWKYFFNWICLDSDELLNQSAQGRFCEKSAWWKLVARIYIGCGICNIVIKMLLWTRPAGYSGVRDGTSRELVAFCADDDGISIWSLMEMEFSLHRMIHKLVSHYANEMDTSLSKEYVRASSYGLHRVLQPEKLQILTAIKNILESNPPQEFRNGISLDAVRFTLDSCWSTIGEEDPFGTFYPRDNDDGHLSEVGSVLEMLLCVYINVRDRVVTMPSNFGADDDKDDERDEPTSRLQFSLFADSISAKFPASARHLVAPGKNAKAVVILDGKVGEELLEHVCAAIGRTLEVMLKTSSLLSVHDEVGQVLQTIPWGERAINSEGLESNRSHFTRLSHYFLSDVEKCAQQNGLTKLGVACAMLSKRLRDIATGTADWNVVCSDPHALSSIAYNVLCENVVYNPRLLRLLMDICLPTHLALHIKMFVTLESKIDGIMQACGINLAEVAASPTNTSYDRRQRSRNSVNRRKRLRQDVDARSRHGLQVDSESDASYSSDFDDQSDDSSAAIDLNADSVRSKQASSTNHGRIPHLQSHASQSIAILAVLAVLDQSQATLLDAMTANTNDNEPRLLPHHQDILGYIRIHEVVSKAISANQDFSWGARKVMLKILHMIEQGLRIGKASGLRKGPPEVELSKICIYESSVTSTLRARTWVDGVKDASQDSGTKTKVSATLLKMDIFFLQVPGTVQTWLKETTVCDETKERLKALVALVKERIAPTEQTNGSRGKAKFRQRLLGVVPIVRKRRKRLRSRHPIIDAFLNEEDGRDAFADLEDFIE